MAATILVACASDGSDTAAQDQQLIERLDAGSRRTLLDLIEYEAAAFDDIIRPFA